MSLHRIAFAACALLVPATAVAAERTIEIDPRAYIWTDESMKRDRELKIDGGSKVVFLLVIVICLGIAAWGISQLLERRPSRRIRRRVARRDEYYY